jgi:hypothetical protein
LLLAAKTIKWNELCLSKIDDFVKGQQNDGFVKSSRCKARKSDGRGNPPGCPISGGSASRPYLLK